MALEASESITVPNDDVAPAARENEANVADSAEPEATAAELASESAPTAAHAEAADDKVEKEAAEEKAAEEAEVAKKAAEEAAAIEAAAKAEKEAAEKKAAAAAAPAAAAAKKAVQGAASVGQATDVQADAKCQVDDSSKSVSSTSTASTTASASAPSERKGSKDSTDSKDLDTAKGDAVLRPMQTVPGVVAHTVGNIIGGASLGAGWALGKADVAIGRHGAAVPVPGTGKQIGGAEQVSDSGAFKLGFKTWLYANGIMPTVLMETGPYGNDIGSLPKDPDARKRLLRSTPLIVSNHVSYLDTVVLPLVLEIPKLMAMSDIAKWPLFGQLCQETEMIWVDRADPDSRKAAKQAIFDHVEEWEDGDRPLLMWPEGECSSGRDLKEFRNGAFESGVPIRPVVIKYTGNWDPANVSFRETKSDGSSPSSGSKDAAGDSGANTSEYGDAEWAQQFFGHIIHSCTVLICRPYRPSEAEKKDPQLFKENVRELMRQRLQELHEQEERKKVDKDRGWNNVTENAKSLFGNISRGADKIIGDASSNLSNAWRNFRERR